MQQLSLRGVESAIMKLERVLENKDKRHLWFRFLKTIFYSKK